MLTFNRPGLVSGMIKLSCPEEVKGKDGKISMEEKIYAFGKKDMGKQVKFSNEAHMIKAHGLCFTECKENKAHYARKAKIKANSDARQKK